MPGGAAVRRLSEDNGIGVLYSGLPTSGCPKGKNRPLAGVGGPEGLPKPAKAPKPQSDRQGRAKRTQLRASASAPSKSGRRSGGSLPYFFGALRMSHLRVA